MGGFWVMDEVYALLDSIATTDVQNIVTDLDTIGTSVEGRPILALGVSDLSRPLGTRAEVLITSLHHAREPAGMQSVMYFLLRLLEGYGVDPVLSYLVNEREIWFVPIVNPDGYVYNQMDWEDSGSFGFWRKNLRDNDSNSIIDVNDGVDLNRNYGYQWGYDDAGSSPDPASGTYRGPGPFSEPETQAMRDFCVAHNFRIANNYHAFWETCLYSWAHQDASTPDVDVFIRMADDMMSKTHYSYGHSDQVLYLANGETNDWMYGEQVAKPKVIAFSSEVGDQNDGFWPEISRIVPLAQLNYPANIALAYGAGVYLQADSLTVETESGYLVPGELGFAGHYLRNIGVWGSTVGGVTVTMGSNHPDVTVLQSRVVFPDLSSGGEGWPNPGQRFLLQAAPSVPNGTRVTLPLEISDGGGYVGMDTLYLWVGQPTVVFADSADGGLANWTAEGKWGIEVVDGDPAFSDSPNGSYFSGKDVSLTLDHGLDLSGTIHAVLQFRTRWEIESGWDFARVEASTDSGGSWTALAGRMTRPGHGMIGSYSGGVQPLGEPGYDGTKRFWDDEEFDLSAYAGVSDLRIRFRMTADQGVREDGWKIDDVTLRAYAPLAQTALEEDLAVLPPPRLSVAPNPLEGRTRIFYSMERASPFRLSIYDVEGREIRVLSEGYTQAGKKNLVWDGVGSNGIPVPAGTYFVHLKAAELSASTKVLVLQ
jgi:hypothetical protein